ncbi:cytochrome P450 [Mycena filopes]|nr:cytochrome P450 [Mycena filopes]
MITPGLFFAAGIFLFAVFKWLRKPDGLPGPRGFPLIGNLFDMPRSDASKYFATLRAKYGDIAYLSVFSQGFVVVNTQKAAWDILHVKGETSEGRPVLTMAAELSGYDRFVALNQPGPRLREGRAYIHSAIGPQYAKQYAPEEEEQVVRFLNKLLHDPENLEEHCVWVIAACILLITYGHIVSDENDPYVEASTGVMTQFSEAGATGRWLVDLIPALKYVPDWFPGAGFKKFARECRTKAREAFEVPFFSIKQQMIDGVARKSLMASYLEASPSLTHEQEEFIIFTMGALFGAGLHTMAGGIVAIFLALVMNPIAQKKAQEEIDTLCDGQRLPTFADKRSLPYVEALIWEILRWSAVAPLGIPHRLTRDETYQGLRFKKNTYIIANIEAILFDPEAYPDPELFKPERFLGPNPQPDPRKAAFGYGRRICPGDGLAEQTMFIIIARTLATFNVQPKKGQEYSMARTDGVIVRPVHFEVDITIRSELARELLASA